MSGRHYADWKGWDERSFGICSLEEQIYFAAELGRAGIETIHGKHILELGLGNGAFAAWACGEGAIYKGTELIAELVERGRAKGYDVHSADAALNDVVESGSQDLVVALDVLEHCDKADLIRLLREAYIVLKPGACLLARMPSGDSPFGRAAQHGDLSHRLALGSSSVHHLAEETGFKVGQVREPAFPLLGLGATPFVRRLAVSLTRKLTYPLVRRAFMDGRDAVLSPNMVFVLAKPNVSV